MLAFFKGAASDYKALPRLSKEAKRYYKKYKKMFDALSYRNAGGRVAAPDASEIRYSLCEFEDGRRFVNVETDQELFDGLNLKEKIDLATKIIKERFKGKVIGIDNRAFVNGVTANEYVHPAKHIGDDEVYDAKMRASAELDNLMDAGFNFREEQDGRDGHTHATAVGGFNYFDVIFKVGDEYYQGVINIEINNRGKRLKDVTKIKNITKDLTSRYGENPPYAFLRDASMDSIPQNSADVNPSDENSVRKSKVLTDSQGNALTEAQAEYFKDSLVRDADGKLKVVYHGSGSQFTVFSHRFIGKTGSAEGQGFYFTDSAERAGWYERDGGQLLKGYLDIKKPLRDDRKTLTRAELTKLLRTIDPTGGDILVNYDTRGGVGYPSRVWYQRSLTDAVNSIMEYSETDSEILAEIANSSGGAETVLTEIKRLFGYDGFIVEGKYEGGDTIYVAFTSEQFKNADNKTPTSDPDIRKSKALPSDTEYLAAVERGDMETAQRMVDEAAKKAGYTTKAYHGTDEDFTVFDRIKTFPGYWFTESREYASEHGKNIKEVYLRMSNPVLDIDELWELGVDAFGDDFSEQAIYTKEFREYLTLNGYDGIVFEKSGSNTVIVFFSEQIKSADPVTYDDEGNIIPLSERFNPEKSDIRYSRTYNLEGQIGMFDEPSVPREATMTSDFVQEMRNLVEQNGGWKIGNVFDLLSREYEELDFIHRIHKDKSAKADLEAFLANVDDVSVLTAFRWYMSRAHLHLRDTPYRGATRVFTNAIDRRINEIEAARVGGRNLGIENGEVGLQKVKELFDELNGDSEIGAFAERVFATVERLGVNIRFTNTMRSDYSGQAVGDMVEYKTNYFNDAAYTDQSKAGTLLHELIHTCTAYAFRLRDNGYTDRLTPQTLEAIQTLDSIFREVKADKAFEGQYGTTSTEEMLAELSDPEFVALLKKKTLWDRILDCLARIFGFRRGTSAYDGAMQCLDRLLDNPEIEQYRRVASTVRRAMRNNSQEPFGKTVMPDGAVRYSRTLEDTYSEYEKPITEEDITTLRSFGRHSINELASNPDFLQATQKWAYKFYKELGAKSPFFRAWFGDWREYDRTEIPFVTVNSERIDRIDIPRGTFNNTDTGWGIVSTSNAVDETSNKKGKGSTSYRSLSDIDKMIRNAILLDTVVIENPSKRLGSTSALMHHFYCPVIINGERAIAKLYVAEYLSGSRKFYLTKIEKASNAMGIVSKRDSTPRSDATTSDATVSIAEIFEFVKRNHKDFESDSEIPVYFSPNPVNPALLNEDGTPKVLYHGTDEDFTAFDYAKVGSATGVGILGDGFYFTNKKLLGKEYGRNLYSVYLRMQNPYVATSEDAYRLNTQRLIEQGYDGVILNAPRGDIYMVFGNTQIKSATDNIGVFDGTSGDIRYSRAVDFTDEYDIIPSEEVKKGAPVRKTATSRGRVKQKLANHTQSKVYMKEEAEMLASALTTLDVSKKTYGEFVDALWQYHFFAVKWHKNRKNL